MRTLKKLLAGFAAAVGITTAATAATPVAIWDGNFTSADSTVGDWTLKANENTVASDGSSITIADGKSGVLLDRAPAIAGSPTVIIRYSDLPTPASATSGYVVFTDKATHSKSSTETVYDNRTGLAAYGTSGTATAIWCDVYNGTTGNGQTIPSAGTLGFCYQILSNTKTSLYSDSATLYTATGLKSTEDINILGYAIGGLRGKVTSTTSGKTYGPAVGMVITKIAVFEEVLTQEQIAAYKFPSERIADDRVVAWNEDLRNCVANDDFVMKIAPDGYASVADGIVTVASKDSGDQTSAYGVAIDWPAEAFDSTDMTVLVKYSSKTLLGGNSAFFSAFWGESGREFVYSGKNNNSMMGTKWVSTSGYQNQQTVSSYTMPNEGVMLVTMKADGSTSLAFAEKCGDDYTAFTQALTYSGMRDANQPFYGIKVAGSIASFNHYYRAGMTIQAVSILKGAYTASDFPMSQLEMVLAAYGEKSDPVEYTATINSDTNWTEIVWTPALPANFHSIDSMKLTVTGEPTLTMDEAFTTTVPLTIDGAVMLAAADSFYADGCWEKTLLTASAITAESVTFASVKEGFYGAYTQAATGFTLRGQNREVISINIGGGRNGGAGTDSDSNYLVPSNETFYGLAPVKGETWNNINRKWQTSGLTEVTMTGSIAAQTNGTIVARPTIDLAAQAKETYSWDCNQPYLSGYLDDGLGVTVSVHGVPYSKYDVIVYSTSDTALQLAPITVNGTQYTFKDGETVVDTGTTAWGVGQCKDPAFGSNALYIKDCTGEQLTIAATRMPNSGPRATVCAVQVINQGTVEFATDYVADMTGDVSWTDGTDENLTSYGEAWENGQLSTITITNKAANATFAFAALTEGQQIKIVSEAGCALTIQTSSFDLGKLGIYDFTEAAGGVTIELPSGEAFDAANLPGTIKGDYKFSSTGTIIFDGSLPTSAQQTFFQTSEWQGTVWLKNVSTSGDNTPLANFCNANSKLKLTGVTGWLRHTPSDQGVAELILADDGDTLAFETTDSSTDRTYEFAKITGDGTFRFATKAASGCVAVLKDVSEFTGKLLSTAGDGTAARPIFIGTSGTYSTKSLISVASDMTINAPCGWEAGEVAFGTNLTVKGASVGTIIVSNVTNEVPVLGTKVTLDGVDGIYCLAYDTEAKTVKIAETVGFTVADCENATFTVAGAFENGGSYYAADGASITVTYTASEGYTFLSTGTDTLVVNGTASSGASFSASETPMSLDTPFIYTIAEGEEGEWTLGGNVVTKEVVDANLTRDIWKQGNGSMTNVVINRTYFVKEGTMVAGDATERTGTVTVDGMATFDFNGKADGYITVNLDGGSLVNNGGNMGSGSRQMNGLALTEDSTIGGTGNFGLVSSGYNPNTLDLGGKTLTKIDNNSFWLCNTTVTNGDFNVTAGTIQVTGYANTETKFANDATLTLAQDTTLAVAATLNIGAITANGEDVTINNVGTISSFTLTGTATLTGSGTWGTNTLVDAEVKVGTKRDLTFAGTGYVFATLTTDEFNAGQATIFTLGEAADVEVTYVEYKGTDITDKCTISGNQITAIDREAKIGTTYYLTLAEALGAAQGKETVTLLMDATLIPLTVPEDVTLDLNNKALTTEPAEVVNNGTIVVYDLVMATALKDIDGTLKAGADINGGEVLFLPQGTEVAHSTEVVESAEHTNNVPTLYVTVPDTKTVIWGQDINPYNKMYVMGDAEFAGDICAGWDTNKLQTVFYAYGALKLNSNVNIGKYAAATVISDALDLNGHTFIINDTDAILTTSTNLVAGTNVTTDKEGYEVKRIESGVYYYYTIEEVKPTTYTITINEPTNGTLETSVTNDVAAGTTVTVTATPAEGYELETITTNGTAITGTTFDMPAEDVTVAATFTAAVVPVKPGEENEYNSDEEAKAATNNFVVAAATPAVEAQFADDPEGFATYQAMFEPQITQSGEKYVVTAEFKSDVASNLQTAVNTATTAIEIGTVAAAAGTSDIAVSTTVKGLYYQLNTSAAVTGFLPVLEVLGTGSAITFEGVAKPSTTRGFYKVSVSAAPVMTD